MRAWVVMILMLVGSVGIGQERLLTCTEQCQEFDAFANQCLYQTTCELQGRCVTHTYCDRWDAFSQTCLTEVDETSCHTPHPHTAPPACIAKCQHFDVFANKCLYRTTCLYSSDQRCVDFISCDRWDSFANRCLSEIRKLTCH